MALAVLVNNVPAMAGASGGDSTTFTQSVAWNDSTHTTVKLTENFSISTDDPEAHEPFGCPDNLDVIYVVDMSTGADIPTIVSAVNGSFGLIKSQSANARYAFVGFGLDAGNVRNFTNNELSDNGMVVVTYSNYSAGLYGAANLINSRSGDDLNRPVQVIFVSHRSCDFNNQSDVIGAAAKAVTDTGAGLSVMAPAGYQSVMVENQPERFYNADRYLEYEYPYTRYSKLSEAIKQMARDLYMSFVQNVSIYIPLDLRFFEMPDTVSYKSNYNHTVGSYSVNATKDEIKFYVQHLSCGESGQITTYLNFKKAIAESSVSGDATLNYGENGKIMANGAKMIFTEHTVSFDLNDGSGAETPANKAGILGNIIRLPELNNLSRGEKYFGGWNVETASGAKVALRADNKSFVMPDEDVKATAAFATVKLEKVSVKEAPATYELTVANVQDAIKKAGAISSLGVDYKDTCTKISFQMGLEGYDSVDDVNMKGDASDDGSVKWWISSDDSGHTTLNFGTKKNDVKIKLPVDTTLQVNGTWCSMFGTDYMSNNTSKMISCGYITDVVGLQYVDASQVTNLEGIFAHFTALKEIDLSSWNTVNLNKFRYAFNYDSELALVNVGGSFNTKGVVAFNNVFYKCSKLERIIFGQNCTAESATTLESMFYNCEKLQTLENWENFIIGPNCQSFSYMFYYCQAISKIDLSHWCACTNIKSLTNMFNGCTSATEILAENFWANSKIADNISLQSMFYNCAKLQKIDWKDDEKGTIFSAKTTSASSLFGYCFALTFVDISGIHVNGSCSSFFRSDGKLNQVEGLDVLKTWTVTDASLMFEGTAFTSLDLSGFGADITNTNRMFCSCSNLTSLKIPNIGANVTNTAQMFYGCGNLEELDLSGFGDASKVTNVDKMFTDIGNKKYPTTEGNKMQIYVASQMTLENLKCQAVEGTTKTGSDADLNRVEFKITPALASAVRNNSLISGNKTVATKAVETKPTTTRALSMAMPADNNGTGKSVLLGASKPNNYAAIVEPTELQPGDVVTYVVEISLDGEENISSGVIEITDRIPEGMAYVEESLDDLGGSGSFIKLEYLGDGVIYAKVTSVSSSANSPLKFTYQAEAPSTRPTVTTFYQEPAEYLYHGFSGESNLLPYYIKASESEVAPTVYTVTYENASVEGLPATAANAIPTSRKVLAGEKITLPDGLKVEGWRFTGWKQGDATVSGEQTISGDTTFTAQWEKVSYYDVTYSFSGTAGTDYPKYAELPESLNVADGNKVELTTPEAWTGWVFGGWKVNGTGTAVTEVTVNGAAVNVVGSWNKNTYSISYATSDAAYTGTLPTNVGAVAWGTTLNVPAAIESFKDDTYSYSFEGWKCDDITIVNGSYEMPMKSITITAQWNKSELPINRTLTLNNAKTSGGETTYQCLAGTAITIVADAAPVGKMFDKWSTISTGIADPYSKTTVFIMPDSDASIEATYKDHVHGNWTYTASGDELICTCGNENCTIDGSKVVFKLTAENAAYTGTPYAGASVTSEQMAAWTASGRVAPSVMYTGREGTSYTANTTAPTNVGKYTAIISEGSGADKCEVAVDFEIAKVALRITANDYEIPYGTDAVGNGVECSGFVGGETIAVLNGTLSYNFGEYTKTSHIGKIFVITPMGLTAENYEISFVSGTMIVIPNELAADQYIIRYKDCNDASFSGTLADGTPVIHSYGTATTLIGATRTGYTFGGWHLDADCADEAVTELGATAYTDDITLYAEWIANQYEIIYKDEGDVAFTGTLATETPEIHTYGTATTLKSATKDGFSFEGWYTSADCAGEAVTSISATAYTDAVVLYAKWTRPHKHIWSYTASGNVITAECSDTFGTCDVTERTLTLTAENATYDGNSHGAAFVESNFAGCTYVEFPEITYLKMDAEGTFSIPIVGTPKNVGIYQASTTIDGATARTIFTIAQKEVTVPAIAGKVYNGNRLTADVDCSGKPYTVTKNEGGVEVGSYEVILTLTDTDDYKWKDSEEDSVTLTFVITDDTREYLVNEYSDSQGNKVSANPKQATYGAKIELTLLPAEGYGLATLEAKNASGSAISIASDNSFIMPQSDVTITAEFVPNTYTITGYFDENGNKVTTDVERAVKGTIVTLTITSAEGYTFKSLTVTDAAGNVIPVNDNKFMMPAANTIIKSEFNKDKPAPAPDPEPIIIIVPQTQPTENSGNEDASGTEETSGTDGTETDGTETEGSETGENADAEGAETEGAETAQETIGTNPLTEKKDALVIDDLISTDNNGEAATEADKEAITEAIVEAIETAIAESGTKDFVLKADEQTVTEQGIENKAYADAATEEITEITKPSETKSVTLESAVMEALASAEGVESLTVMTSVADVEFDAQTIESINEQSDGSVQLVVTLLKEEIAQTAGENNKVYFDVSLIREDGSKITTFDGGSIKVTVPIPKACQNEPVVVVYTDSKGHYSPVNGVVNSDGTFTFITEHLSEYILMTKREAEEMYNSIYDFSTLKVHVEERTADSITIDWDQYEDADGYIIYGNYCDHDGETYKVKKLATITDPSQTEYTIAGLEEGTNYKFRIKAFKLINGEKYGKLKTMNT